jgi:hypothetical protein
MALLEHYFFRLHLNQEMHLKVVTHWLDAHDDPIATEIETLLCELWFSSVTVGS